MHLHVCPKKHRLVIKHKLLSVLLIWLSSLSLKQCEQLYLFMSKEVFLTVEKILLYSSVPMRAEKRLPDKYSPLLYMVKIEPTSAGWALCLQRRGKKNNVSINVSLPRPDFKEIASSSRNSCRQLKFPNGHFKFFLLLLQCHFYLFTFFLNSTRNLV